MAMFGIGAAELLVLAALFLGGGAGGAPLGGTPLPPDAGLQAAAPPECLLYVAHHGLAAPDPKSTNHFEQLLAEPENQAFFAELNRLAEQALKLVPPNEEPAKLLAATMPTLIKTVIGRPSMLYIADVVPPPQAPTANAGFVLHAGDQIAAIRDAVEQWERLALSKIPPNMTVETLTVEGVKVRKLPFPPEAPPVVWGITGEYLFVAVGQDEAANLLKRLHARGEPPKWLQNLTKDARVPRVGGMIYFNFAKTYEMAQPLLKQVANFGLPFDVNRAVELLGLPQLKYIALASGLNEDVAVSKLLIGHEADAQGIFSLLGGKPIGKAELADIPRNADFAMVARFDGAAVFDQLINTLRELVPQGFEQISSGLEKAESEIGFSPRRDLLDGLGDLWAVYNSPTEGGSILTGACAVVSVHDKAKVERVIEQLLRIAAADLNRGDRPAFVVRKTTVGERTITYVQILKEPVPVAPAWCLTDDRLILALSPQMVRAHLTRPKEAGSLADVEAVAKQLATGDVTALTYADTTIGIQLLYSYLQYGATVGASILEKETGIQADLSKFPSYAVIHRHMQPAIGVVRNSATVWSAESYATGPSIGPAAVAGVSGALFFAGVKESRASAIEVGTMNSLRQISIAATAYEQDKGKPLPRAILSPDGKPLLSWRVALLPYLDHQALYEQFHLDEPWDSDHNRKLITALPGIYQNPSAPQLRELGATTIQIPIGEGTLYGEEMTPKKSRNAAIAVWFVTCNPNQAVVWSKPDDVEIDPESPFDALAPLNGSTISAARTDGSVFRVQAYGDSPAETQFLKELLPNK